MPCAQAMLRTLQKQNKGLEATVARHRAAAAAAEALRQEATAARAALQASHSCLHSPWFNGRDKAPRGTLFLIQG